MGHTQGLVGFCGMILGQAQELVGFFFLALISGLWVKSEAEYSFLGPFPPYMTWSFCSGSACMVFI